MLTVNSEKENTRKKNAIVKENKKKRTKKLKEKSIANCLLHKEQSTVRQTQLQSAYLNSKLLD